MNAFRRSLDLLIGRRPLPLQVGAICAKAEDNRVLLITSRGTGRWVIPKGWPMEGRSLQGAAEQEAWEEAGIKGTILRPEIGRYTYPKEQESGYAFTTAVAVYLLQVESVHTDFPEASERELQWFTPREAAGKVAEPGLKKILLGLDLKPV